MAVEAEAAKSAEEQAYNGGRSLASVTEWPDSVPAELRGPGLHHCPFAEGDPQREHWLQGLRDGLDEPRPDPADVLKQIDDELGG
jgi:hypothetical protein